MVVIEHHLDLIKRADWIVDLGPEAGANGGTVVATGPPEVVAREPASITGRYLAPLLQTDGASGEAPQRTRAVSGVS